MFLHFTLLQTPQDYDSKVKQQPVLDLDNLHKKTFVENV